MNKPIAINPRNPKPADYLSGGRLPSSPPSGNAANVKPDAPKPADYINPRKE
ncbi:hypothetical protein [Humisphaera borealis]|uniref:Uncharacterized protein n=1 Tax=Humisphaera borealis TaxID=2807512 RepID=A0A7M2X071_9BACT|nr:hypothetical protein [Humisphaera borealis]QOV91073.1 hypothetical protein IPV69_06855 [Humisphaera borealis]